MRSLKTLLLLLITGGALAAQDINSLPLPIMEEVTCPPRYYFNMDIAFLEPRFRGVSIQDGPSFSPKMDWTTSPHFEFGLLDRGPWNFYIGYRGIYSDASDAIYDRPSNTIFSYNRSADLNAIDFGVLSEPFPLLSVIRAQWDFSIRLTVADFQNCFGFDFNANLPSFVDTSVRQQFVGAGPRAGMRFDLPFRDSGLSLAGQIDGGIQWGTYESQYNMESRIDGVFDHQELSASKGGVVWHAGAQLALRYVPLGYCDRLSYTCGYMYEAWFSKDLGLLEGSTFSRFDYHGPFFRIEWKY